MRCCALAVVRVILAGSVLSAAPATDLERSFQSTVKPFVAAYCLGCHSGSSPAAMFDLKPYTSAAAVVKDYGHWNSRSREVSAGQMPPKGREAAVGRRSRKQVIEWIQAMRD